MAEKDTIGTRLKEVFVEVTSSADTGVEHAVVGGLVGAGIIFRESSAVVKRTAEFSGRVGRSVVTLVYEKASQRLR